MLATKKSDCRPALKDDLKLVAWRKMENRSNPSLLGHFLPTYDFNEVHTVAVHAPLSRVFTAIKEVELQELPLFRILFGLRGIPKRLRGFSVPDFNLREPLFQWACRSGFVLLAEVTEQELVFGAISQPWRLTSSAPRTTVNAQEFLIFTEPEYVKIAANFRLEPVSGSSVGLSTETRIWSPDSATRARFAKYWRWVRPGSGLIRREWLRAIKRRAERPVTSAA